MRRIHVFPAWWGNPYLNMLYLGARVEGWDIGGSTDLRALIAALRSLRPGDVLHLHWTGPIMQGSANEREARAALDAFRAEVDASLASGVRLLWTVHNKLTHDAQFVALEVELAEYLARSSTRIIQLHGHTRDAVADLYDLPPAKLVTLRHASYAGIYTEPPAQAQARADLGIPLTSPTVGFVGQMRAYKGLMTLVRAMGSVSRMLPDITLLLAGKTPPDEVDRIDLELPAGVRAIRHHRHVADGDLGTWFAAADVMVFPYERILNSGSVLLSATFGRPCILPAEPHLIAEYGAQPWVSFFEAGDDAVWNLAVAIHAALTGRARVGAAARAYAAEYTTWNMSWDYVQILADVVDERTDGGREP